MSTADATAFNHIGHCVTDLDRARRFYEELLGFKFLYEISPPDEMNSRLLRVSSPVGLRAAYLRLDGLILELLHFARPGNPAARERVMNEPGLTHLSISVRDVPDLLSRVPACGGTVLEETNLGAAVMIRDPDGQVIEILPMGYREKMSAQGF